MVLCSSMRPLQSHLLFSSFLTIALCFPFVTSLNFSMTNTNIQNIKPHGSASLSEDGIQLTRNERGQSLQYNAGRAMYGDPLPLWDEASGNLADFNTYFKFVIDSEQNLTFADGLAFFLIPPDTSIVTSGGAMGLPSNSTPGERSGSFVAIEFDTFNNPGWDPDDTTTHVGIDINSIKSNVTAKWESNIPDGIDNEAWISYNSSSKNLSVVFTGSRDNTTVKQGLSLLVDLRHYLPPLVRIGFSASTGELFEQNNVTSWNFSSTLQIVPKPKKGEGSPIRLIVGLTVGLSFLVVVLALVGLFLRKRRNRERKEGACSVELSSMEEDFETGSGPKRFSYVELCRATNNFNEQQKLGEGGFGGVYRGFLKELNSYVAVKRISKGSKQGIKEYAAEVKIISRLRHRNLVQLIGWCHEKRDLLLVYEFMANASLDTHLFKGKSLLAWGTRSKIARSLALALLYLHEEWEQCVVHRDVKSSNVMLDQHFNAKLGDFGLARLVDHEKGTQTTVLAGTMGYMAPECVVMGKASKESDVYSFGIVVLEIACGRKSIDISVQGSQVRLVDFVWNLYGDGNLLDAVDPKIGTEFDREEMERLMIVGLWCAHPDHKVRPSIRHAIHVLSFEAPLPLLPGRMPVASYFSLPVNSSISSILSEGTSSTISQTKSLNYSCSSEISK